MEVRFKNWGVPVKIRSEDVYESNLTAWKETNNFRIFENKLRPEENKS